MNQWDFSGMRVWGTYLDEFPVTGKVSSSRIAYGGRIKHTVVLDQPLSVYGVMRDTVIISHESITRIAS